MNKQIILSPEKILEHNEKAFNDTIQLISKIEKTSIDKEIKLVENDPKIKEIIPNMFFDKGRTIWLELKVEDSYLSGLIMSWLYSKSEHDGGSDLHALGCSLKSVMFSKPSGFTDSEKDAIKSLYESAFGTNQ